VVNEILSEAQAEMDKTIEAFKHEMTTVRTGRASASLLESIRVEYYGAHVPILQVANVAVPEARLIVITPYDKSAIPGIQKAIQASNLGLTPQSDGQIVRLPVPQLTEERRKELVKVVRHLAEECRVSIRNHRRDANEMIKEAQKDGEVAEDDAKKAQDQVQKITDGHVKRIDDLLRGKETEIMEV
jgi:ribosome recycling factor